MTDIATLGIELRVKNLEETVGGLNKVTSAGKQAEEQAGSLAKGMDKLGYSMNALQGMAMQMSAAFGAVKLMELAKDAMLLSARYETLGVVMSVIGKTAGYTASQMSGFQSSLQSTGISAIAARQSLALMGQAQIDFANSAKLARIAQDAAVVGNINSSEAFQRMMTGLATGQSIILHHLGLMTNFEDAYIRAAHAAGKTTKDLSETEKAAIRVNEVVRAGAGIAGAYEAAMGTVGKQLTSLPRYFQDLMVQVGAMGQGVMFEAISGLTGALKYLVKNFDEVMTKAEILAGVIGGVLAGAAIGQAIVAINAFMVATKAAAIANTVMLVGSVALSAGLDGVAVSATLANKALSFMGGPLGILIGLITAAGGAWLAYIDAKSKALDKLDKNGDGSESDRLVKENAEIREKIRLLNQTPQQAKDATASAMANKIAGWKKEEAALKETISANIYYDEVSEKRLAVVQKDIAFTAALTKENQKLTLASNAQNESRKPKAETVEKVDKPYNRYLQTFESLNKQIEANNPYLDEYQKKLSGVDSEIEKAIVKNPLYAKSMREQGEAIKWNMGLTHDLTIAIIAEKEAHQLLDDHLQKEIRASKDLLVVQREQEAIRQQEIDSAKQLDAMKTVTAGVDASQVGKNSIGGFDGIADQAANQMAVQEAAHQAQLKRYDDEETAFANLYLSNKSTYEQFISKTGELDKQRAVAEKDNSQKTAAIGVTSYKSQLGAAASYTGMAGQLFSALATTQDQSSRSGFESAKAFNIAAAIMSTAAAVMNAFATMPWPMAPIAAGLAAATGALQIAKIASTSFGGGSAGVSAPSGSFAAGGAGGGASLSVGSSAGSPITSIQDQQTGAQLDAIAEKMGNAALAMGKSADSLYIIANAIQSGGGINGISAGATNKFANVGSAINGVNYASNMVAGQSGIVAAMIAPFTAFTGMLVSLGQSMFGHGAWRQIAGGIELGMANGELSGQGYIDSRSKGGLFTSDRNRTDYQALDPLFLKGLNAELDKMQVSLKIGAVAIGLGATTMETAINAATLDLGRIETAGRSTEDIAKDIGAAFTSMSNEIITKAIPNIADYAISSAETATETYNRLASAIMDVTAQFTLVGKAVEMVGMQGAVAAYNLQQLFGGADKMATAMDDYFTTMYTDTEQAAMKAAYATTRVTSSWAEINNTVAGAGLELPKTNAAFNALRNSITDPALFTSLTLLGPTFAEMTKQSESLAKTFADSITTISKSAADAIKGIQNSSLSTESPEMRYARAQQEFLTATPLLAGDLGKSLLDASRAMYASGDGYMTDYANVMGQLTTLAGLDTSVDPNASTIAELKTLKAAIQDLQAAIVNKLTVIEAPLVRVAAKI